MAFGFMFGGSPVLSEPDTFTRFEGETIRRNAQDAHRLALLHQSGKNYAMTLFMTGPKKREWGFWYLHGWVHNKAVCRLNGNVSTHQETM